MIVEQIWTANAGRNFNYLIACAETGEALAVDPLDHEKCLAAAQAKGWNINQILDTPALFCGDTLFNAGAGNCHNGGRPNELYNSFVGQLAKLPEETLIYPGHDYIARNLAFTLDREPDNAKAKTMLPQMERQDPGR